MGNIKIYVFRLLLSGFGLFVIRIYESSALGDE